MFGRFHDRVPVVVAGNEGPLQVESGLPRPDLNSALEKVE
jgi:hypothetical protein